MSSALGHYVAEGEHLLANHRGLPPTDKGAWGPHERQRAVEYVHDLEVALRSIITAYDAECDELEAVETTPVEAAEQIRGSLQHSLAPERDRLKALPDGQVDAETLDVTMTMPPIVFSDEAHELWESEINSMAERGLCVGITLLGVVDLDAFLRPVERDMGGMPVLCFVQAVEGSDPGPSASVIRVSPDGVLKMEVY